MKDLMQRAINFHGHSCSGLAIGVLASKYILENGNDFSIDEELVAVVETDSCGVDAIQVLIGTTFGKGNLIHLDYGKNVYNFFNRINEKAIRISLKDHVFWNKDLTKEERTALILDSNPEEIFNITKIEFDPPEKAQIHNSILCDNCGDSTMSTRIKVFREKNLCIPCYQEKIKG